MVLLANSGHSVKRINYAIRADHGKVQEALGGEALDENGKLQVAFKKIPVGKKYLEEMVAAEAAYKIASGLNVKANARPQIYLEKAD